MSEVRKIFYAVIVLCFISLSCNGKKELGDNAGNNGYGDDKDAMSYDKERDIETSTDSDGDEDDNEKPEDGDSDDNGVTDAEEPDEELADTDGDVFEPPPLECPEEMVVVPGNITPVCIDKWEASWNIATAESEIGLCIK